MFRRLLWAIAAAVRPKVLLIADNLCSGKSCWSSSDAGSHGHTSRMRTGGSGFWHVGGLSAGEPQCSL
jgi:hypothetical protein